MDDLKPCDCPWQPHYDHAAKTYERQVHGPDCSAHTPTADVAGLVDLQPMENAPRNRTHILAKTLPRSDNDRFAGYGGRWFVVWHINTYDGAEDWSLFPGFSVSPEWFEGWTHLPLSAATALEAQAAEIARLREALRLMRSGDTDASETALIYDDLRHVLSVADAALTGSQSHD